MRVDSPCQGHDSPEGAREHYRQYLLDTAAYDGVWADVWRVCLGPDCGELTNKYASLGPGRFITFDLCNRHRNREVLDSLFVTVGDAIHS